LRLRLKEHTHQFNFEFHKEKEMADFRKLLLALMAGILLFTTVAASADSTYACSATAVPVLVRSEGLAEPVGDIELTCSGTIPSGGIMTTVRLTLSTNITSNSLTSSSSVAAAGDVTEAMLILDSGANGYRGYQSVSPFLTYSDGTQNLYQGIKIADNQIEWNSVWLAAPSSTGYTKHIRITNVRGNAYSRGDYATIYATINLTGASTVGVDNNMLVVADTTPGMVFSVTSDSYKNCVVPHWHLGQETGYYSDVSIGSPSGSYSLLTFTELFSNAFRPVGDAASDNTVPGGGYKNESGFNPGSLAAGSLYRQSSIGQASFGTRLFVRLKDVPSDVTVKVPTQIVTPYGMVLDLVDTPGSAGASDSYSAGSITATAAVTNNRFAYEVTDVAADSYAPLGWEEDVEIPVFLSYTAPATAGVTVTASGTLAPISTVGVMDYTAPEPRFADKGVDKDIFTIGYCRTVLLFPYVTNQANFDTGIAIANTSSDPLYTSTTGSPTEAQSGVCKLYYYGNTSGGAAPAAQTSPTVAGGGHFVMMLSGGGGVYAPDGGFTSCDSGACVAPLFQGYMFALCDFQYAHGFAFVSDYGSTKLAMGYLALVVPDNGYDRNPTNAVWSSEHHFNSGEQLSQ